MTAMDDFEIQCPYCWETIVLEVDASAGSQSYTEDCSVCCQPLLVRVEVRLDGGVDVSVERE